MEKFFYHQSSVVIVVVLMLCMVIALEVGFLRGRRRQATATDSMRSQVSAVLGSMIGLLALLLGFTFSLAMQRYEARTQAIVAEMNAFGTAYLRSSLLPADMQDEAQTSLREFLDVRIQEGRIPLGNMDERRPLLDQADLTTAQLWEQAVRAIERDPRPVTSGAYMQALNELFDSDTTRFEALARHVPEIVLVLLFLTSTLTAGTLGFASGLSGERASIASLMLVTLIVLVTYLIIEVDRPRSGLFRPSAEGVLNLQKSIHKDQLAPALQGAPPGGSEGPDR